MLAGADWPPDPFDDRNEELNHRFEANLISVHRMGGGRRVTSTLPRLVGQDLGNALMDVLGPLLGNPEAAEVSINRLQAGCKIPPHKDGTVKHPDRLQFVLQSNDRCFFNIGDESIQFRAGDLWRIEGVRTTTHWATNDGNSDRIVAVIDAPDVAQDGEQACSDPTPALRPLPAASHSDKAVTRRALTPLPKSSGQLCSRLATGLDVAPLMQILSAVQWGASFCGVSLEEDHRFEHHLLSVRPVGQIGRRATGTLGQGVAQIFADACLDLIAPLVGQVRKAGIQINRLPPGREIPPHKDGKMEDGRFHLVLQASANCWFHIGEERIEHRPGDFWRIEQTHSLLHGATNGSNTERIVVVIDLPAGRGGHPALVANLTRTEF